MVEKDLYIKEPTHKMRKCKYDITISIILDNTPEFVG
jgi:hypothetical protein